MNTKAQPATICVATMDTRHYSFKAVGHTQEEARQALFAAWQEHYRQCPPDAQAVMPETLAAMEREFGPTYEKLEIGQGYRDGSPLPRKSTR